MYVKRSLLDSTSIRSLEKPLNWVCEIFFGSLITYISGTSCNLIRYFFFRIILKNSSKIL